MPDRSDPDQNNHSISCKQFYGKSEVSKSENNFLHNLMKKISKSVW